MLHRYTRTIWLWAAVVSLAVIACDASTVTNLVIGMTGSKPTVTIQSPSAASVFREGDEVTVTSVSRDQQGIIRVELSVDGSVVSTDAPPVPKGQTSFTLVQRWKATAGSHTLSVRAFNSLAQASDPALVTILVSSASGSVTPLPTAIATATAVIATPAAGRTLTATPALTATFAVKTASVAPSRHPTTPATLAPTAIKTTPGVWALGIRVDPKQPYRGVAPTFYATFYNNTGSVAYYTWYVKIFEPDKTNSKGETSKIDVVIPPGTSEHAAPVDWKITGPGPCEPYIAHAFSYNRETKETTEFNAPGGGPGPTVAFQVCP